MQYDQSIILLAQICLTRININGSSNYPLFTLFRRTSWLALSMDLNLFLWLSFSLALSISFILSLPVPLSLCPSFPSILFPLWLSPVLPSHCRCLALKLSPPLLSLCSSLDPTLSPLCLPPILYLSIPLALFPFHFCSPFIALSHLISTFSSTSSLPLATAHVPRSKLETIFKFFALPNNSAAYCKQVMSANYVFFSAFIIL